MSQSRAGLDIAIIRRPSASGDLWRSVAGWRDTGDRVSRMDGQDLREGI